MPEVAGIIKCPICGAEEQEVRINKNRNLYVYCERGCKMTFSGKQSRKYLAQLAGGNVIKEANFAIFPQKMQQQSVQQIEKQQEKGVIENGKSGGNPVVGRPDGQSAAVAGVQPAGRSGRGWLADFLGDDDE